MADNLIYKQVQSIELAPDALLFINGKDTIKDENNEVYEIRNDITSITTSLNIESVPGSASFTVSLPDHSIRRFGNKTYRAINIMSEVEIYMKGRFEIKKKDNTYEFPYYPVFWGMISSVNESYGDGVNSLQFTCVDILYWWKIVNTGVNFSIVTLRSLIGDSKGVEERVSLLRSQGLDDAQAREQIKNEQDNFRDLTEANNADLSTEQVSISPYGNIYADYTIPDVIAAISKTTLRDFAPISRGINYTASDVSKNTAGTKGSDEIQKSDELGLMTEVLVYWKDRLDQIGKSIRMFGFNIEKVTGKRAGFKEYDFKFDEENFGEIRTAKANQGSAAVLESTTKSKLDLANDMKNIIQFEFFMDVNGEIIFKPPFYNIDVRNNVASVVEDTDIITWGFIQSESEVVTRVDVTGELSKTAQTAADKTVIIGIAINSFLAKQYGLRLQSREVHWLSTSQECLDYAKSELDRLNAMAKTGTLSIIGRPELRLGYPIYIPSRDVFYYVKSIEHNFEFGNAFTTNLGLVAERKKLRDSSGNPLTNRMFRSVGEVTDDTVSSKGGSIAEETEYNNYVKQMTIQKICSPSKRGVDKIKRSTYKDEGKDVKISGSKDGEIVIADDKENDDDIYLTDNEGYEMIGNFKYGRDLRYEDDALVKVEKRGITNAEIAVGISPSGEKVYFTPNNTAMTLDNETSSMLELYSKDIKIVARKAEELSIEEKQK